MNRVVITGVGSLTPLGTSYNQIVDAMFAGTSGIEYCDQREASLATVKEDFNAEFDRFDTAATDRTGRAAWVAFRQARNDSDTTIDGVYLGTGAGGAEETRNSIIEFQERGKVRPNSLVSSMASGAVSFIARQGAITGPVFTHQAACASSSVSIGEAYKAIKYGEVNVMAAGGTEFCLGRVLIEQWRAMRALGTKSAPFSADRNGIILGEGSVIFVLENLEHALARKAKIYAEILGYGVSCGSETITKPNEQGQIVAINAALKGIDHNRVTYVNAHGTGTPIGDLVELGSISKTLPEGVAVSSTKAIHGHLLGCSGAIEMIACLGVLERDRVIPNWGLTNPDPAIPAGINLPTSPYDAKQDVVLNNSFAFGGTNVVIALAKYDPTI